MKRKLLSLLLTLSMVLSLLPTYVFAANFTDTQGHWGEAAINRWSAYGVVNGVGGGKFAPNGTMTRAQAAQVFTKLLGLKSTSGARTFSDVPADAWYADAIAKASAAGILNGVGNNKMNPDGAVTREQFFVMFARALGLKEQGTTSGPKADGSAWSAGYINALTDKGYVRGDGTGVNALANINRASVMSLLDQTIRTYINESGTYTLSNTSGITLVAASGVTLKGTTDSDIVIAQGADGGSVVFSGATVTGSITAQAANAKITYDEASKLPAAVINGTGTTLESARKTASGGGGGGGGSSSGSSGGGGGTTPAAALSVSIDAAAAGNAIANGASLTVNRNDAVTLTAKVTGASGSVTYAWYNNSDANSAVIGTGATYTVGTASATSEAVQYSLKVVAKDEANHEANAVLSFTLAVVESPTTLYTITTPGDIDHSKYTDNVFAYDANKKKIEPTDTTTPIASYEIKGTVSISSTLDDGDIDLTNIKFENLVVEGGGSSSINLNGVTVDKMEVNKTGGDEAPRIHPIGATKITALTVKPGSLGVILEDDSTDANAFPDQVTAGANVTLQGANTSLKELKVEGGAASVTANNGAKLGTVDVQSSGSATVAGTGVIGAVKAAGDVAIQTNVASVTATGSNTVSIEKGAVVTELTSRDGDVKIEGQGTVTNPVKAESGKVSIGMDGLSVKLTGATVDVAANTALKKVTMADNATASAAVTGAGTVDVLEATKAVTLEVAVETLTASAPVTLNNGATVKTLEAVSAEAKVKSDGGTASITTVNAMQNVKLENVSVTTVTVPEGSNAKVKVELTGTTSVNEVKAEGGAEITGDATATVTKLTVTGSEVTISGGSVETVDVNNKHTETTVTVTGAGTTVGTVDAKSGVKIDGNGATVANLKADTGTVTVNSDAVKRVTTTENSDSVALTEAAKGIMEIELGSDNNVAIEKSADLTQAVTYTSSVVGASATVNGTDVSEKIVKKTPAPSAVVFKDSQTAYVTVETEGGTFEVDDAAVSSGVVFEEYGNVYIATVPLGKTVAKGGTVKVTYTLDETNESNAATSNKWAPLSGGTLNIPNGYLGDNASYKFEITKVVSGGAVTADYSGEKIVYASAYEAALASGSSLPSGARYEDGVLTFSREALTAEVTQPAEVVFTVTAKGDSANDSATVTVKIGTSTKGVSAAPAKAVFATDANKMVTKPYTLTVYPAGYTEPTATVTDAAARAVFAYAGTLTVYGADGTRATTASVAAGDTSKEIRLSDDYLLNGNVTVTYTSNIGTESSQVTGSGYTALAMTAIADVGTQESTLSVAAPTVTGGAGGYTYAGTINAEGGKVEVATNGAITVTLPESETAGTVEYAVTVTATDAANQTVSRTFTVAQSQQVIRPTAVNIGTAAGAEININEKLALSATVTPSYAANTGVTWTIDAANTDAHARVEKDQNTGVWYVSADSAGKVTLIAKALGDENVTQEYTLVVKENSYALTVGGPAEAAFAVGGTKQDLTFKAAVTNNGKPVSYGDVADVADVTNVAYVAYEIAYYGEAACTTSLGAPTKGFSFRDGILTIDESADWGTATSSEDTIYARITAKFYAEAAGTDAKADATNFTVLTINRTRMQLPVPVNVFTDSGKEVILFTGIAPTSSTNSDGKIQIDEQNVKYTGVQWSADGKEWKDVPSNPFEAGPSGTYYLRYKEIAQTEGGSGMLASDPVAVIVPAYTAKLSLTAAPSVLFLPEDEAGSSQTTITAALQENGVGTSKVPQTWTVEVAYVNGEKQTNVKVADNASKEDNAGIYLDGEGLSRNLYLTGKAAGENGILGACVDGDAAVTSALLKITATYANGENYTSYVSVSVTTRYTLQRAVDQAAKYDGKKKVRLELDSDEKFIAVVEGNDNPQDEKEASAPRLLDDMNVSGKLNASVRVNKGVELIITGAALDKIMANKGTFSATVDGGTLWTKPVQNDDKHPLLLDRVLDDNSSDHPKDGYFVLTENATGTYTVAGGSVAFAFARKADASVAGGETTADTDAGIVRVINDADFYNDALVVNKDVILEVAKSLTVKIATVDGTVKLMKDDATFTTKEGENLNSGETKKVTADYDVVAGVDADTTAITYSVVKTLTLEQALAKAASYTFKKKVSLNLDEKGRFVAVVEGNNTKEDANKETSTWVLSDLNVADGAKLDRQVDVTGGVELKIADEALAKIKGNGGKFSVTVKDGSLWHKRETGDNKDQNKHPILLLEELQPGSNDNPTDGYFVLEENATGTYTVAGGNVTFAFVRKDTNAAAEGETTANTGIVSVINEAVFSNDALVVNDNVVLEVTESLTVKNATVDGTVMLAAPYATFTVTAQGAEDLTLSGRVVAFNSESYVVAFEDGEYSIIEVEEVVVNSAEIDESFVDAEDGVAADLVAVHEQSGDTEDLTKLTVVSGTLNYVTLSVDVTGEDVDLLTRTGYFIPVVLTCDPDEIDPDAEITVDPAGCAIVMDSSMGEGTTRTLFLDYNKINNGSVMITLSQEVDDVSVVYQVNVGNEVKLAPEPQQFSLTAKWYEGQTANAISTTEPVQQFATQKIAFSGSKFIPVYSLDAQASELVDFGVLYFDYDEVTVYVDSGAGTLTPIGTLDYEDENDTIVSYVELAQPYTFAYGKAYSFYFVYGAGAQEQINETDGMTPVFTFTVASGVAISLDSASTINSIRIGKTNPTTVERNATETTLIQAAHFDTINFNFTDTLVLVELTVNKGKDSENTLSAYTIGDDVQTSYITIDNDQQSAEFKTNVINDLKDGDTVSVKVVTSNADRILRVDLDRAIVKSVTGANVIAGCSNIYTIQDTNVITIKISEADVQRLSNKAYTITADTKTILNVDNGGIYTITADTITLDENVLKAGKNVIVKRDPSHDNG